MVSRLLRSTLLTSALVATPVAANQATPDDALSTTKLKWIAPDGCPTEAEFLGRVTEYLGKSSRSDRDPSRADAVVVATSNSFHVTLRIEQAGNTRVRVLDTKSCSEALNAAALVVALAIDPSAGSRIVDQDPTPTASTNAPRPIGTPPFPAEERSTPQDVAKAAAMPAPQTVVSAPAPTQKLPVAKPLPNTQPSLAIFQVTSANLRRLPGVSLGLGLGAAFNHSRLRLSLAAITSDGVARSTSGGGEFRLIEARAQGCLLTGQRLRIGPCAAFSLGALTARGFGIDIPERKTVFWWSGGVGVLLQYMPSDFSELGFFVNAEHPFSRTYFELSGKTLFRPPAIGFDGGLMLGLRFE